MGDPKHSHKTYQKPPHPWQKERIVAETELRKEYGVKNKREIWKMQAFLRNFSNQAKKLIAARGDQAEKERKQLIARLQRFGLVGASATLDNVLSLTIRDIMERRLQTQVYKKGLARTPRQARQFITHGLIVVGETMVTSPSYLVPLSDEVGISFIPQSTLADPEHPERRIISESKAKKEASESSQEEKGDTKKSARTSARESKTAEEKQEAEA